MADKIAFEDVYGAERVFETDMIQLSGMNGRFMPPITFVEEKAPFQAGSRHRQTKIEPRDVDVPIWIKAKDEIDLRNKMRQALRTFNPLKGVGKLKVTAPDGSRRELACMYSSGLEGKEDKDSKGIWYQKAILVFRAFDPFWYDTNTIVHTFKINESPGSFFPFFPLRLSSSTIFADITIDNIGDVETWPEWIIHGPFEHVALKNLSTGEIIELDLRLEVGESFTIDTRPFYKTVTKYNTINLYSLLSEDSSLWALQDGINNIRIELANATKDSSVQLSYRPRYWGP